MRYAKLIDGKIVFAPRKITVEQEIEEEIVSFVVYNPNSELIEVNGWLPIVYTDEPGDAPEGYYYLPGWDEEDGQIVQTWELVEEPDDISDAEALEIIMGGAVNDED